MADKEEIRSRSDIVEVVGTFVPLKKRGRNFLGLCPFHQEKTPSFNVDPITQSFKCFGCGVGGDVFSFVERFENMTFVEAAEYLARRVGLELDRRGGADAAASRSERETLYDVNRLALDWFRKRLDQVQMARDYLYGRGIAHETVQKFQLGYAPEGWDNLTGFLQSKRVDMQQAETAGLVRGRGDGTWYDVFRHRILFPIHDEQERIVGFGGRAFGDDQPKYLNTGETPIFAKSRLLYGLPFARRKIASEGRVLLMEGYMDVIAAHQAEFTNAVATLGTSLTEEHAKKIARLMPENPTAVLVYDADAAGVKATLRGSEILEKEQVAVRVVSLPQGDDPDSLLKRGESDRFQKAIDTARDRIEYLIEYARTRHDVATEEGKVAFLGDVYRILAKVESRTICDRHLTRLANYHPMARLGVPVAMTEMWEELEAKRRGERPKRGPESNGGGGEAGGAQHPPGEPRRSTGPRRPWTKDWKPETSSEKLKRAGDNIGKAPKAEQTIEERSEMLILRSLEDPAWRDRVLKAITPDDITDPLVRRLARFVIEYRASLGMEEAGLYVELDRQDPVFSQAVRERMQESHARMGNEPVTEASIVECVGHLRRARTTRVTEELAALFQKPELTPADRDRVNELHRLFRELKGSAGSP